MRGKITKKIPMPNAPGTYWVFYEGRKNPGIWHDPDHGKNLNQGQAQAAQGSVAMPNEWSGGTTEGEAATQSEIDDIEAQLMEQRKLREDYGRDQHYRAYSQDMEDLEKITDKKENDRRFVEIMEKYPDFIQELPEKKGK